MGFKLVFVAIILFLGTICGEAVDKVENNENRQFLTASLDSGVCSIVCGGQCQDSCDPPFEERTKCKCSNTGQVCCKDPKEEILTKALQCSDCDGVCYPGMCPQGTTRTSCSCRGRGACCKLPTAKQLPTE
ncbi:uncharacterized protein LOC144437066 [Glandiceps talaboti]